MACSSQFVGCGGYWSSYRSFKARLQAEWDALQLVLTGGRSPLQDKKTKPSDAHPFRKNAELLREIFVVVFERQPEDRQAFGEYVDSMNQGASLEGLYNGFTHSSFYRELESDHPGSTAEALSVFAEELLRIQAELKAPTRFNRSMANPLPRAVQPGQSPQVPARPAPAKTGTGSFKGEISREAIHEVKRTFGGASYYTLKRILGDEALLLIAEKSSDPEALAEWYANWVVRLVGKGVDFGLGPRNRADVEFHRSWARTAGQDRLTWEVLNRVHRVINHAQKIKKR